MIDSEDHSSNDANYGHEGISTSIIAGVDALPIREFFKHILNLMSLTIEFGIMRNGDFAVSL